jgi:hypothetical protein
MAIARSIVHNSIAAWIAPRRIGQNIVKGFVFSTANAVILLLILLPATASFAVQPSTISAYRDPAELMRKAVENEIKAANDATAHFLFRGTKTTPKGSTTKIYVETKDATAGLIIAYNDKVLTPEQRRDEEARVERFVSDPEELKKKRQQERESTERTLRIVRALPDAFLFEYAGEEQSSEGIGRAGDTLIKLKLHPNPSYQPPSRVEEILTGMQGYVLVDPVHYRLASVDGTLFKSVSFGWGILGHLDRGGRIVLHQQHVGGNDWEISCMTLNFSGRILLVKSFSVVSTETFTGFRRVPSDLTFAQALELMKKEAF